MQKTTLDKIYTLLEKTPQGISEEKLAITFLQTRGSTTAQRIIHTLLGGDPRFVYRENRWFTSGKTRTTLLTQGCLLFHLKNYDNKLSMAAYDLREFSIETVLILHKEVSKESPPSLFSELTHLRDSLGTRPLIATTPAARDWLKTHIYQYALHDIHHVILLDELIAISTLSHQRAETMLSQSTMGIPTSHENQDMAETVRTLLQRLIEEGHESLKEINTACTAQESLWCETIPEEMWHVHTATPDTPGVFALQDAQNRPIHIEAAAQLKHGLSRFFQAKHLLTPQEHDLQQRSQGCHIHPCSSELEARLLAIRLRRKYALPELFSRRPDHPSETTTPHLIIIPQDSAVHTIWYAPQNTRVILKQLQAPLTCAEQSRLEAAMENYLTMPPAAPPALEGMYCGIYLAIHQKEYGRHGYPFSQ
ncbi:hypothetical protein [Chitinivibrio alkaliphilus]|uniref:Uncharacterized protein n=1 Tax=Chitinivibrio alkaliphilus ACht1 TaxID=1313304 RepID=U7D3S6_9BACT|nr:hypothetical protein [Chitinivibrio alkaliphilus]ERP31159.1 hypothetical protein CALK_1958 [Chitinivibrio alkaliphilus ACht1]